MQGGGHGDSEVVLVVLVRWFTERKEAAVVGLVLGLGLGLGNII